MKIIIITNQDKSLKETGFGSMQSCNHVLEALLRGGFDAELKVCRTEYDLNLVVKLKPDLVVLAVKYVVNENNIKISLANFFDSKEINYTGSDKDALEYDSDKTSAKVFLQKQGLKTAKYFTALPREYKNEGELPLDFPLFLKPFSAANGNGIDDYSFVSNFKSYERKVLSLYNAFDQPVLVEEYLDGREFTVAIIEGKDGELIVSAIEIVPPESSKGLRILGARTKSENSEVLLKIQDQRLSKELKDLAISSFQKIGGRDFGRIDIKQNKNNESFFIEANLVPGMTATSSYFPRAYSLDLGIEYDEVIELIISQGKSRVPIQVLS